jgi:hypothetical protein
MNEGNRTTLDLLLNLVVFGVGAIIIVFFYVSFYIAYNKEATKIQDTIQSTQSQ